MTKLTFMAALAFVPIAVAVTGGSAIAQESAPLEIAAQTQLRFGGPDSVGGLLEEDARPKQSLTGANLLEGYTAWKERLREDTGLSFTLDYTTGVLAPSNTISGEDVFASGAVRFYGSWEMVGRGTPNTGSLVFKVENRHGYDGQPVQAAAGDIGYAGAILSPLSDQGSRLTNLYWKQNLNDGRVEIIAGMLDVTDWVDVYALASPWSGFFNFAFATGAATIGLPDDATLGLFVNAMLTDNLYVIAGFADANADSGDPWKGFETFPDHEFFKAFEIGWTTSQDRFYLDNTHLTFWHVDERVDAGVEDGWGVNFSYTQSFNEKWLPFFRAGYADGGGSLLQKSVSTGFGYHLDDNESLLGLGVNWGEPNEKTFGKGLDDQYAVELFTRFQIAENIQITPDIQYIANPVLNPDEDSSLIFGLRAQVSF